MVRSLQIDPAYFRQVRRQKGMTQSELAARVDAAQSGISMFEAGNPNALSDDKVRSVAEALDIDLDQAAAGAGGARGFRTVLKFCTAADCPSVVPYMVGRELCLAVTPVSAPGAETTWCRHCGEVLAACCGNPVCGASLSAAGAFCAKCGEPYVRISPLNDESPERYVEQRQAAIRRLRLLSSTTQTYDSGSAALDAAPLGGDHG